MTCDHLEKILSPLGQRHLLRFWPQIDTAGRRRLAREIMETDWDLIALMRRLIRSTNNGTGNDDVDPVQPARIDAAAKQRACADGEAALREGRVAVLLVAGGQGSRLGFAGPKGAFPIGPVSGSSLFELHARRILALERRYATEIPFLVMTSPENDADTRKFFEKNLYFGLAPQRVRFFAQGMLPAMFPDGRLALGAPDRLFKAPDGHGGAPAAARRAGMFPFLRGHGVDTVFYFQVDNPLVNIADPFFVGYHRLQRAQMSLKVCAKRSADEGLGVVVMRNSRPEIIEYSELTEEQQNARAADGSLRFGYGSAAIHVFALDFFEQQAACDLPLHCAFKKIPVCRPDGRPEIPDVPNGFKFERFIFDILPQTRRMVVVPFDRRDEFAPVKNPQGEDSPEMARRAMVCKDIRRLEEAGIAVPRGGDGKPLFTVEIDPLFALNEAELRRKLPPELRVDGDIYLR